MHYLVNRRKHFRTASSTWTANNETISAYDSYLKAYYHLEDTSDSAGTHTLTNVDSVSFATDGKHNKCATLNGSSQSLYAAGHADFNPGAGDFFLSMWVNLASSGGQVFCGCVWNSGNRGWNFQTQSNLLFRYSTDGSNYTNVPFTWTPVTGAWVNVAIGRAGADLRAYVNGSQVGDTHNIGTSTIYDQSDDPYEIGVETGSGYLNGSIDEHGFWKGMSFVDVAAMDTLVSALYNSGTGAFLI